MNRPTLILLVGIPGSGKTTYAKNYIEQAANTVHLSSDSIRKELYGDESIQGNPADVFSLMQKRAVEALNNGNDVLYDATNITRKDRASIINICPKFAKIECHIIWAPIEMCIERDASRDRTVGKEVIDRMLKRFQAVYYDEGIDDIHIVLPDKFDKTEYTYKVMDAMKISHDNPHHTLNIHDHCVEACTYAGRMNYGDDLRFAALCHDIGKPYTKSFVDNKGNKCETAHYYSHQNLSTWLAYGLANITPFCVWLIGSHMEPFFNTKYYKELPVFLKCFVDCLHECDLEAH